MSQKDKRFVIQQHSTADDVHWDLMLESGNSLKTYRLDKSPAEMCSAANAERIADHSLKFLTYQGPVNKGRGSVCLVEAGSYKILQETCDLIELNFNSQTLKGRFNLTYIKDDNWLFTHKPKSI